MPETHTIQHLKKRAFLAAYSNCGVVKQAAATAKIDRSTFYEWRKSDLAFAEAVLDAYEDAADALEAEAWRRAFDGSDVLLIFMIKGFRPSKFRDRIEHGGIGGGPIKIEMTQEDEAVARRIVESRFQLSEN